MNRMKKTANAVKKHFTNHGYAYVITSITVAGAMVWVENTRARELKAFLETKGIDYQEFVNTEWYKETHGGEA